MNKLFVNAVLLAAAVWGMLDSEAIFCEAQAVTSTGDTASTNVYDSQAAASARMGKTGENLWLQALCSTTPTSSGSATIQAVLQDSADNSAFADLLIGPSFAYTAVAAGTRLWAVQPPLTSRRYLRVVWRIGTAALTAGKFDAFFSNTVEDATANPSGFSVQ
jgi:hypothetical protein